MCIRSDFYALYHAAVNVSRGLSPYDDSPDGVTPYYYPFRYLPIVAYAAQPLLKVTPQAAWLLWVAAIETLLFLLIAALKRHLGNSLKWLLAAGGLEQPNQSKRPVRGQHTARATG